MKNDLIVIGEIVKPKGIKGELKIKSYSVSPEDLQKGMTIYVGETYERYTLTQFALRQGFLYVYLKEVPTVMDAEKLRNKKVYIAKADIRTLDENEFLIEELIGCRVELTDGRVLGTLEDVQNFGSTDIFYVKTEQKKQIMFPNVEDVLENIDLSNKIILVNKTKFDEVGVE